MLFPAKHISVSESLVGLGSFVLETIDEPMDLDEIWVLFRAENEAKRFLSWHSFENIVLAVDFLFMIGAVTLDEDGKLSK